MIKNLKPIQAQEQSQNFNQTIEPNELNQPNQPSQQSQQNQQEAEFLANSSENFEHLKNIKIDGLEVKVENPEIAKENPQENVINQGVILTKEQFFIGFKMAFDIGGTFSKIESLKITKEEEQGAMLASDCIYDIAFETPFLRFLIEPSNIWLQRAIAIGAFSYPKILLIKAELKAKKEIKEQQKNKENQ